MSHTWEMHLCYERCPKCGFVFEDRKPYLQSSSFEHYKNLKCPQCHHGFIKEKKVKPHLAPFTGTLRHPSFEWGEE